MKIIPYNHIPHLIKSTWLTAHYHWAVVECVRMMSVFSSLTCSDWSESDWSLGASWGFTPVACWEIYVHSLNQPSPHTDTHPEIDLLHGNMEQWCHESLSANFYKKNELLTTPPCVLCLEEPRGAQKSHLLYVAQTSLQPCFQTVAFRLDCWWRINCSSQLSQRVFF